jgi:hypothetical protein
MEEKTRWQVSRSKGTISEAAAHTTVGQSLLKESRFEPREDNKLFFSCMDCLGYIIPAGLFNMYFAHGTVVKN